MSVYGAMNAAVSGMKAQSRSLGNISDNIANSQTTGYKRVDTSFAEMVTNSTRTVHAPGGVLATPRYRHNVSGDINQTQTATNMAVSEGDGMFVVSNANSVTPQGVAFDSNKYYTRRGDFELDKFGYLRNGSGYYLNGRQVLDQSTLNTSDLLNPIRIQTDVMEANETSRIKYSANLPDNSKSFPSAVNTLSNGLTPGQLSIDASGATFGTNGDTMSISLDTNNDGVPETYTTTYDDTATPAVDTIAKGLADLRSQILTDHSDWNVVVSGTNLTVAASDDYPHLGDTNVSVTNMAISSFEEGHETFTFAGTASAGDIFTISVDGVEYEYVASAGDSGDDIARALADQIDSTNAYALGSDDAASSGVTSGTGELKILTTNNVSAKAVSSAGADYVVNLANSDEQAMYQAEGSYSGGAVTVYNELGTPFDVQMRWLKTGRDGEWTLLAKDPNASTDPWVSVGTFGFTDGVPTTLDGAPFTGQAQLASTSTHFSSFGDDITLDFQGVEGQNQLTSFYGDDISVYRLEQDGYQAGILSDVSINDYGYVVANYDNGRSRVLYQVPLATFASPNELGRMEGGAFNRTPESGDPLISETGTGGAGSIIASATESSNVDIADEFTKMIVTQRAYSANSRTVSTADDMLQEVVNLKR